MISEIESCEENSWLARFSKGEQTDQYENLRNPIVSDLADPHLEWVALCISDSDRQELFRDVLRCSVVRARDNQSLFIFGGQLVEVVTGLPVAVKKPAQFRSWAIDNSLLFYKDGDDGFGPYGGQLCPVDIATLATARLQPWKGHLQEIQSFGSVPFFLADGSAVTKVGYHPELKLFNVAESGLDIEEHRARTVTQEEAQDSLNWLLTELFNDFPFVSEADRANAVGLPLALLTQRIHGHDEALPLVAVTGTEAGTGKTILTKAVATIASLTDFGTTSLPTSEDELVKVVVAILRTAQPVPIWDNIKRGERISSRTLCQLHTSAIYTGRTLGVSEMGVYRNDRLWLMNGNQIFPAGDLSRRWMQISLDAGMKDPALAGRTYRHPDLIGFIRENRAEILRHYYVMFKAWLEAGQPSAAKTPTIDSFQQMTDLVSGVLEFAGLVGFWTNMDAVQQEAAEGSDDQTTYDFLRWIATEADLNPDDFTSNDVVAAFDKANGSMLVALADRATPLPDVLVEAWRFGKDRATSLGKFFSSIKKQRFSADGQTYRIETHPHRPQNRTHFKVILEINCDQPDIEDHGA